MTCFSVRLPIASAVAAPDVPQEPLSDAEKPSDYASRAGRV
jgi:hypothetical protein